METYSIFLSKKEGESLIEIRFISKYCVNLHFPLMKRLQLFVSWIMTHTLCTYHYNPFFNGRVYVFSFLTLLFGLHGIQLFCLVNSVP